MLRFLVKVAITRVVAKLRLENHSLALPRDVAGRDVMKLPEVRQRAGQLDDVARAAGINPHRKVFRNGEVVNCREMKHARRLSFDQFQSRGTQRQSRLSDVSLDKLKVSNVSSAELRDAGNLLARTSGE